MKRISFLLLCLITITLFAHVFNTQTEGIQKLVPHGNQRRAIISKTLTVAAGAIIFQKGGNAGFRFDV